MLFGLIKILLLQADTAKYKFIKSAAFFAEPVWVIYLYQQSFGFIIILVMKSFCSQYYSSLFKVTPYQRYDKHHNNRGYFINPQVDGYGQHNKKSAYN